MSWTLAAAYDIIRHMPSARLIFHDKIRYRDGAILEMTLWEVPASVRGSRHEFKYSLFYGEAGIRLIGYDNEAGKGDHRHYGDQEHAYDFSTPEQLIADFLADVARLRGAGVWTIP